MSLHEKITQEELALYEIIRHPVLCGEFINNYDKLGYEEKFEYSEYQKEILCNFNNWVSICAGRAVGKTVSLVNLIIWCLINNVYPGDYLCYHVPGKSHVEPVFNGLVLAFRTNNVLKHFIDKNSGVNRSDLTIRLNNGSSLLCRIAGQSGTGVAVVGLHSPFVIVDEAGYYPYGTWLELIPTVNQFTSGFRVLVSGVPTGLRERNVLFHTDQENESYSKHRISALSNPRFTKEDNERAIDMYGGDDTEDYIHLVLGEHGKPVFALFDRNSMDIQSYPVYKISIDGTQLHNDLTAYIQKLSVLPNLHNKTDECIFGIDLGFTEPTAISILSINSLGIMKFHARITLSKVNYHIQEKIIDYLDTRFTPKIIGIDEGSSGKAVIPRLLEHEDFIHKGYKDRLVGVNFSGWTVLGTDTNGEEIKNKTKPLSVSILQDYTINHKIVYSSADMDMIIELERMTYVKNPQGDITYRTLTERGGKKGDDHFTASLLCMAMAYYTKLGNFNFRPQRAKLLAPRWTF